jgi:hypothetical protein
MSNTAQPVTDTTPDEPIVDTPADASNEVSVEPQVETASEDVQPVVDPVEEVTPVDEEPKKTPEADVPKKPHKRKQYPVGVNPKASKVYPVGVNPSASKVYPTGVVPVPKIPFDAEASKKVSIDNYAGKRFFNSFRIDGNFDTRKVVLEHPDFTKWKKENGIK